MKRPSILIFTFLMFLAGNSLFAQVNGIKSASSNYGSTSSVRSGGSDAGYSGGYFVFDIFFNVVFGEIIRAQQNQLQRRHEVPGMISFEAMVQTGVQPSGYYLIHPRARVNWGLFSSDFRFNYLIEEGIDEVTHIRTNDWQILQLNLVRTRDVTFRIGGGIMTESYSGDKSFPEWTAALQFQPHTSKLGGVAEYRDAEVRTEVSAFAQYNLFNRAATHGFVTGGAVFQRYYNSISVWGMQGGLLFKFY